MSMQHHNAAIAGAMEFSAQDLDQNRQGELSPDQWHKLDVMRDTFIADLKDLPLLHTPSIMRLMTIGVVAGICYVLGVFDRLAQVLDQWYSPVLLGTSLLILGWFVWTQVRFIAVRVLLPGMLDDMVQTATLYSVTGAAVVDVEAFVTATNYWLVIDDQQFPLTTKAAQVFQTGRTYRVYYVHFADALVMMSAEWLADKSR